MNSVIYKGKEFRFINSSTAVSKDGLVLCNFELHTPFQRPDGYLSIGTNLVHRLVALCWIPNPKNRKIVHHKDGNKANNHSDNLEWVTPKEHIADKHKDVIGKHVCPEWVKEKNRKMRLGTTLSEDHKTKISEGTKAHFQNPENFAKYRESLKTRKANRDNSASVAAREIPCEINGVRYQSVKHASKTLGIIQGTLRKRLLSKNFPNYVALKPVTDNCGYKPKKR